MKADRNILIRLITIVADAAREGAPLSHLAVVRAVRRLSTHNVPPYTIRATPAGTILALWPGWQEEIGPDGTNAEESAVYQRGQK